MKQEATKKSKLWLWILIGVIALLAVAGVVLAMVLGPSSKPEKEPGGRPELYWNLDKATYTENSESGLSTREPGEDGLYKVRFAYNGNVVEYAVADKPLVNFIDTMDAMGLVLDADGVIIDAINPKDIATEKTKNAYVKSATEKKIVANSSIAMNGMNINIELCELTEIYDVTPGAEVPGQVISFSDLGPMDVLTAYANDLDEVTHVYLTSHPKQSKVYWRADQFYNSTEKSTTREPDENGVYTIPFYCEGETVELKFKDKALVTKIDSASRWKCHYGLTFDEEGYVIEQYVSSLGIQGVIVADCWDIVAIDGDQYTIQRLTTNDGSVWTGTIPADCEMYEASAAAKADKRGGEKIDSLKLGDRVTVWTDTNGEVVLVYVSNRLVDSPAYWVTARKYSSAKKESTRTIGASGYYEVELIKEGTNFKDIYYIRDKETVDYFDSLTDKIVGLRVSSGNMIEAVYNCECLTGYTMATRGGVVTTTTGGIFTKMTYAKPGTESNMVLAENARIYNVSQYGTLGEATTVMPGDHIYALRQPTGEIAIAFITKRTVGGQAMYWNLKLMYDKTAKETTREPDEDGWYYFDMVKDGKQVKLKTKSKELATKIDSQSIGAVGLTVSGDVITAVFDPAYAYGGNKVASGYRYRYITEEGKYHCVYTSDENKTVEFKMADDCVIYNVSAVFDKYKGERIYSIKYNDMLTVFCDIYGEAKVVYVRNRDVDNMYWKTDKFYDSTNKVTTRVPDADGYYRLDLAVNGEVKTFKCKDIDIVSSMDSYDGAFGLNVKGDEILGFVSTSYVKDVKGNSVIGYTVKKIEGNKVTVVMNKAGSSFGTEKVIYTKSSTKVYDVSPTAEKFGAEIKLQVGDTFRSYLSRDGKTDSYIYVTFHATREGGEFGYCEVCKKNVQWAPWAGGSVPAVDGAHVYLNATTTAYSQTTMATKSKDYTVCLDLNGHTLTRQAPGRAFRVSEGEMLNIIDSVGGGKIVTNGGKNFSGGMAMISTGGKINIYGGTFEFIQTEYANGYGGNFYISGAESALSLYDGVITGGVSTAQSNEKPGYGGNIYAVSSATFNMYGGKVSNGKVVGILHEGTKNGATTYTAVAACGGNIYLSESAHLNIQGGVVENGSAVRQGFEYNDGTETKTIYNIPCGGNIYKTSGSKGTVTIKNATITGGQSHRGGNIFGGVGTITLENVTITDGVATQFGGNIMSTGGNWTVTNTKILNGQKPSNGGNIYSQGGVYNLVNTQVIGGQAGTGGNIYLYKNKTADNIFTIGEGTVVDGGVAEFNGGNIYIKNKNYDDADGNPMLPTLVVAGGKVINGVCDSEATGSYYGGNIYAAGHLTISGGEISGGLQGTNDYEIYIPGDKTQEVRISGGTVAGKLRSNGPKSFVIEGAPKLGQLNLRLSPITVGELKDGTQIKVLSTTEIFSAPCEKAQAYVDAGYFLPYDADKIISVSPANELMLNVPKIIKWCDHCSQNVEWQEYAGNEVGTGYNGDNLHLFLPEGGYTQSYGQIDIQGEVTLDLNGETLTGKVGKRLWKIEGIFNIIDTVGGGRVESKANPAGGGGIAMARKNPNNGDKPVINLYAGTLTLAADAVEASSAGILNMTADTTLNMYGGEIKGGKAASGAQNLNVGGGVLNMSGGFIDGGIIASATSRITLSGNAKIANTNDGLALASGCKIQLEAMTDAEIYVSGEGAITDVLTNADAYLDNIKAAASGWSVSNVDGVLTLVDGNAPFDHNAVHALAAAMVFTTTDPDGKVTAECPVCRESVEWLPLPNNQANTAYVLTGGHFYLSDAIDYTANNYQYSNTSSETVCINLNGQTMQSTVRAFYNEKADSVLNIMGNGTVSGAGTPISGGYRGMIDQTATINLYGGNYISTNAEAPAIENRASSHGGSYLNIYAGTTISNTAGGTAVQITNKGNLNICGGTVGTVFNKNSTGSFVVSGAPVATLDLTNGAKIEVGALTDGAQITVLADGVFTADLADAAAAKPFFNSGVADKTVIIEGAALAIGVDASANKSIYEQAKEMDFTTADPDGKVTAKCPVCGTEVEWLPLPEATGTASVKMEAGHYYLSASVDYTQNKQLYNFTNKAACIHLNGQTMTSTSRAFYNEQAGATLNFMGDGTVSGAGYMGTGTNAGKGYGAIDLTAPANFYGGTYISTGVGPAIGHRKTSTGEALVTINEGTTVVNETADGYAVHMKGNGSLAINGGTITGRVYDNGCKGITVSGAPVATLDLTNGAKIDVGALTDGAQITVLADGVFTADLTDAAAAKPFFESGVADKTVIIEGAALAIGVESTEPEQPVPTDKSIYEQAKEMDFTTTDPDGKVTAKCPVCGTEVEWLPLPAISGSSNFTRKDGADYHYYLSESVDYTQNTKYYLVGSTSTMCINLNGQDLVTTSRAFIVDGSTATMNLMGDGHIKGHSDAVSGVYGVNRGVLDTTGTMNIYGGTYESTNDICPVLAVRGSKDTSIANIYEGTTIQRTADGVAGLCVYVFDGSTLNMYDGVIAGGNTTVNDIINGGNILIDTNDSVNTNERHCAVNVYGGTITGGADAKGGNVYVQGNDLDVRSAVLNIQGGVIADGGVYATGTNASVNVSGAPVVDYLDMVDANLLTVGELTDGASINVLATDDVAFTNEIAANADTYAAYFHVDDLKKGVIAKDNVLKVVGICPHCNVPLADITWTELANTDASHKLTESGHYKLTEDINAASGNAITMADATATTGLDLVLDTCGFDITSAKGRCFYVAKYNKFTVFDSVGGSQAVSTSTNNALGGSGFTAYAGAEVNFYDLTLQGADGANGKGNCVSVYATSTIVNIYSGNFIGTDLTTAGNHGGTVYNHGTLNIYGGTFSDAQVTDAFGGCLYSDGTLNIQNAELNGDVYIAADTTTISGDTVIADLQIADGVKITLGELTDGADITVDANGEFTVANENAQAYLDAGYIKAAEGKTATVTDNIISMAVSVLRALLKKLVA